MAMELEPAIRAVLEQVEAVLHVERVFDPAKTTRRFVIGLSGYSALVLLPQLMERMNALAPAASLIVKQTNINLGLAMLDQGEVELIAGVFPSPPSFLREELLYVEDFVCAARAGHPLLKDELDLETYLSLRHLQVSMRGNPHGIVDNVLDELGCRRTIALTVGHFLMAPLLIQSSELVATEPRRLFERWNGHALCLVRPPIAIPSFRVVQTWHTRHENDPAHMWLRELIRSIAKVV
jgi:DNA-binding transcriptional LysR family regulator